MCFQSVFTFPASILGACRNPMDKDLPWPPEATRGRNISHVRWFIFPSYKPPFMWISLASPPFFWSHWLSGSQEWLTNMNKLKVWSPISAATEPQNIPKSHGVWLYRLFSKIGILFGVILVTLISRNCMILLVDYILLPFYVPIVLGLICTSQPFYILGTLLKFIHIDEFWMPGTFCAKPYFFHRDGSIISLFGDCKIPDDIQKSSFQLLLIHCDASTKTSRPRQCCSTRKIPSCMRSRLAMPFVGCQLW